METISKLVDAVVSWTGDQTRWSQWVGAVVVACILEVFVHLSLAKREPADMGVAWLVLFAVFVLLARKTPPPSAPAV